MTCQRYDPLIEAYVDGECPDDRAAGLRDHFRTCATCRGRAEELSRLQELVHDTLSGDREPDGLWARISDRLDRQPQAPLARRSRGGWGQLRGWLAAAVVVLVVAAGSLVLRSQPSSELTVVHETVQDFVTFQLSGRPFDSIATDPIAVRAWFADKIRFELPALKSRAASYELVGSRLCWLLDRRLGAFTYRRDDRLMTLYVMEGGSVELSGGHFDDALGAVVARHRADGHNSLVWRRDGLLYSLVSDAPEHEMTAFAVAVLGGARPGERVAGPSTGRRIASEALPVLKL